MADLPTANTGTTDAFGGPTGASTDVAPSGNKQPDPAATSGGGAATTMGKSDFSIDEGFDQGGAP